MTWHSLPIFVRLEGRPVILLGDGDAAVPSIRNPISFSATPADYRYPLPALDEHADELRAWLRGDA